MLTRIDYRKYYNWIFVDVGILSLILFLQWLSNTFSLVIILETKNKMVEFRSRDAWS